MKNKSFYESRRTYAPEYGRTYINEGGGEYRCISQINSYETAWFQNVASGWVLIAHMIGIYEDGTIDWDYSNGIEFRKVVER